MNLEKIRKEKGISQCDLALSLGVTQGAVSMWESGAYMPSSKKLLQLAAVLGCTVDELLKGEEKDAKTNNDS